MTSSDPAEQGDIDEFQEDSPGLASPSRGDGGGGEESGGRRPTVRTTPIPAPSRRAVTAARAAENGIRFDATETGIALDRTTGRELFRRPGTRDRIQFTSNDEREMRGQILTHNHPGGVTDGPVELRGISFSEADVELAAFVEVAEVRVITAGWRYTLRPPPTGWNRDWWQQILVPEHNLHRGEVLADVIPRMVRGELTRVEGAAFTIHETWVRVAKALGMTYNRMRVRP